MSDEWNNPLAVSAATLERQVRSFMSRGYRPARAREILPGGEPLLHVTFDDAYRSVEQAVPVLAKLGVPFTVFACTGHADQGTPMDLSELAAYGPAPVDEARTMNWDELRAIADAGAEVGSHTISHARLTLLSDAELERELRESRERIEAELERSCRLLAYPYGNEDERVHAAARAAGYEVGFAWPGRLRTRNAYAVPRVGIARRDGMLGAALKASTPIRAVMPTLRSIAGKGIVPDTRRQSIGTR